MRKLFAYTQSEVAVDVFEKTVKFDDETSALAICNHEKFVILASSNEKLIAEFEKQFETKEATDLDVMNLQLSKEIKEIRGKEYTLMPFT